MRVRTALLALIPGAAHVDLGRPKRGLLWFFLFAFLANGALIAPFVSGADGLRTGCLLGAAGVWITAFYGALRTAARQQRVETVEPPSQAIKSAEETRRPA